MPQFQIPQEYKSHHQPEYLQYFFKVQDEINSKIQNLDDLNNAYKDRMERQFLITFSKLMNKMSEDLILAQQAYKNIDKEIATDSKCITLAKQINFFKGQCNYFKESLQRSKKQVSILKERNMLLLKQKEAMGQNLLKKVKQNIHYKTKCKQYEKQFNISVDQQVSKDRYKSLILKNQQNENDQSFKKDQLMGQIKKQIQSRKHINFSSFTNRNNPQLNEQQTNAKQKSNSRSKKYSSISKRMRQTNVHSFCDQSSSQLTARPKKKFDLKQIAHDIDLKMSQKCQSSRQNMTSHRMRSHRNSAVNQNLKGLQMSTIY